MSKRIFCLVLAMMLTLGASVSALADETAGSISGSTEITAVTGNDSTATATLNGTIKATNLSVTVPSTIPFYIDPTADITGSDATTAQITPPTGDIKITNNSVVPVYAKISAVSTTTVSLVNEETNLGTTSRSAMLGIKKTGDITDFTTESDWLMVGENLSYYLSNNKGYIGAKDDSTNGNTLTLEICGLAGQGWSADNTFSVTTTVVVSVTEPTAPANET